MGVKGGTLYGDVTPVPGTLNGVQSVCISEVKVDFNLCLVLI